MLLAVLVQHKYESSSPVSRCVAAISADRIFCACYRLGELSALPSVQNGAYKPMYGCCRSYETWLLAAWLRGLGLRAIRCVAAAASLLPSLCVAVCPQSGGKQKAWSCSDMRCASQAAQFVARPHHINDRAESNAFIPSSCGAREVCIGQRFG